MGDEGLIFDESAGGLAFLHVSDVTGVRPAADVAASAAEHDLIRRAEAGPEAVWKSNFGRPTPSTRRCSCDRGGSMTWRFTKVHAIFLRIT